MVKPPQSRGGYLKSSRKFDVPLFTTAWALGKLDFGDEKEQKTAKAAAEGLLIFSGGGGEGRHGVKSKIVMARFSRDAEELSEEVLSVSTGDKPAFKLAVHPHGDAIIASFAKGCRVYRLHVGAGKGGVRLEAQEGVELRALKEDVEQKAVVFSPDGSRVAFGDEEGRVVVLTWPTLEVVMDVPKAHTSSIKDASFSVGGALLATTADAGPGRVWGVGEGKAVATLSLVAGCRLGCCRFSLDERRPFLFGSVVKGGRGFIVVWDTRTWRQLGVKRVSDGPICSFAIRPDSALLAYGTADGDVAVVDVKNMAVAQRAKGAHMVFVTALQFSPDGRLLASVSGDSSVRVTPITVEPSGPRPWQGVLLFVLLVVLSIVLAVVFASSDFAQWFFQFPAGRQQPAAPYWQPWPLKMADTGGAKAPSDPDASGLGGGEL